MYFFIRKVSKLSFCQILSLFFFPFRSTCDPAAAPMNVSESDVRVMWSFVEKIDFFLETVKLTSRKFDNVGEHIAINVKMY